ncbi:MAG TPA: ABC transporter ATP-binding protein [Phycisphaerae bacterium]|nr:ABC transporter ATP-binding protein [Phycisphaerae bacterium]
MKTRQRILWELLRGNRLLYSAAVAAILISAVCHLLGAVVVGRTIDYAIMGKALEAPQWVRDAVAWLGGRSVLAGNLWIAGAAVVLLRAVGAFFSYLRGRWSALASESMALRLRDRLYDKLQRLPCRYHDRAEPGDLVQRCTSDVETIRMFLSMQLVEIFRAAILLACGIVVMLYLSPPMMLVGLAVVPIIVTFAIVFFRRIRDAFKLADEAEGKMTAVAQENLTGIRVVRAFARQQFERARFAEHSGRYRNRWFRLIRLMSWYWSLSDLMCFAQNGLVIAVGGWWVMAGTLQPGTLIAIGMVVNMFLWPVRMLGRILSEAGKAVVSLGRVGEILNQPIEQDAPSADAHRDVQFSGQISIRHLSYSFEESKQVLSDLSVDVPAGTTLALLGPSGSGKSVLVNLLLRLYDYERGAIEFDGHEIRALPRSVVRSQIGVVLQEPFLYSRTVRDNIRLGHSAAEDTEVEEVARAACLHDSIMTFEGGYDSVVGERGVTLSGGQRQRLALARAMVKDPPVLILDDALSAVDTVTEQMILSALERRRGRRTTIVIAHRLSTLSRADRIVVLDEGHIVQSGTHAELVKQEGLYKRLWEIQTAMEADLKDDMRAV